MPPSRFQWINSASGPAKEGSTKNSIYPGLFFSYVSTQYYAHFSPFSPLSPFSPFSLFICL